MGKPYSRMGIFGNIEHFDENGKKIGESRPGLFAGSYDDYDAEGHKVGTSWEKLAGIGYNHYDDHGNMTGSSDEGLFGGYTHRDADGHVTGTSERSIFDTLPSGPSHRTGSIYAGNHIEDFEDLISGGLKEDDYIETDDDYNDDHSRWDNDHGSGAYGAGSSYYLEEKLAAADRLLKRLQESDDEFSEDGFEETDEDDFSYDSGEMDE